MPCTHKFFGHPAHMAGDDGLLPNWDADTLIIGTFNPTNEWVPNNAANYFYGRSRYFWKVLPVFACHDEINNQDDEYQLYFLKKNQIALTDLLVSIDDADIHNQQHVLWIQGFLDNDLNNFHDFIWNTHLIVNFIIERKIKAVYFTKMGNAAPFGAQMEIIEAFCNLNNIINFRLHTPNGQGLGPGAPRTNKLICRWHHQGGDNFPFLCQNFDLNDFPWN